VTVVGTLFVETSVRVSVVDSTIVVGTGIEVEKVVVYVETTVLNTVLLLITVTGMLVRTV
jgi:hypothetical protein